MPEQSSLDDWLRTSAAAPRLVVLPRVDSTNSALARALEAEPAGLWPEGSVVLTLDQTAGRGRLGRSWVAPPGCCAAVTVLLRPVGAPPRALGWLPLLAGVAMAEAIAGRAGRVPVGLKWPNDVLLGPAERKVCGVLAELRPDGAVILGAGVNLSLTEAELPVPTATSIALETGHEPDADALVAAFVTGVLGRVDALRRAGWDPRASGVDRQVDDALVTIGRRVRVEQPAAGGETTSVRGRAIGLDEDGRLLVRTDGSGATQAFGAGDVTHLRYE